MPFQVVPLLAPVLDGEAATTVDAVFDDDRKLRRGAGRRRLAGVGVDAACRPHVHHAEDEAALPRVAAAVCRAGAPQVDAVHDGEQAERCFRQVERHTGAARRGLPRVYHELFNLLPLGRRPAVGRGLVGHPFVEPLAHEGRRLDTSQRLIRHIRHQAPERPRSHRRALVRAGVEGAIRVFDHLDVGDDERLRRVHAFIRGEREERHELAGFEVAEINFRDGLRALTVTAAVEGRHEHLIGRGESLALRPVGRLALGAVILGRLGLRVELRDAVLIFGQRVEVNEGDGRVSAVAAPLVAFRSVVAQDYVALGNDRVDRRPDFLVRRKPHDQERVAFCRFLLQRSGLDGFGERPRRAAFLLNGCGIGGAGRRTRSGAEHEGTDQEGRRQHHGAEFEDLLSVVFHGPPCRIVRTLWPVWNQTSPAERTRPAPDPANNAETGNKAHQSRHAFRASVSTGNVRGPLQKSHRRLHAAPMIYR